MKGVDEDIVDVEAGDAVADAACDEHSFSLMKAVASVTIREKSSRCLSDELSSPVRVVAFQTLAMILRIRRTREPRISSRHRDGTESAIYRPSLEFQ